MSVKGVPTVRDAAAATALGLFAALAVGLGLNALAKAPDFSARVTAVEGVAGRAQALARSAGREVSTPPGAVCRGQPADAARRLHDTIATQATQAGLSADLVEVTPGDVGPSLAPLQIRISVSGSYEGALSLLADLARARPQVFADSVDLTPKVSNVTLVFSGRAFCAV